MKASGIRAVNAVSKVSVVMPCLNEALCIVECVRDAHDALGALGVAGEVIVVDNGSTDGSAQLASDAGAQVIEEPHRGYGRAYMAGFEQAAGDVIVMIDADRSYDFREIPKFVEQIRDGADLVIGDRMQNIQPGAMSPHRRWLGNPFLSGTLKILFKSDVKDAHCGLRALRRDRLEVLQLRTTGMEFASEMIVQATKKDLKIDEVPIQYKPRVGKSKLHAVKDGWRHLRFLLLESPSHLFLLPGVLTVAIGLVVLVIGLAPFELFGTRNELPISIGGSLTLIMGVQVVILGMCAHVHRVHLNADRVHARTWLGQRLDRLRVRARLEHGLSFGVVIALVGAAAMAIVMAYSWTGDHFSSVAAERVAILAATLFVLGIQVAFSSCLVSILAARGPATGQ